MVKIPDFEYYYITQDGRVYSSYIKNFRKLKRKNNGYIAVDLCVNNVHSMHYVHRLVASAYIPNPDNKPYVNHIDGNKDNNHVTNLEWVTAVENMQHAVSTGLLKSKGAMHDPAVLEEALSDFLSYKSVHYMEKTYKISYKRILSILREYAKNTERLLEYKAVHNQASSDRVSKVSVYGYTKEWACIGYFKSMLDAAKFFNKTSVGAIPKVLDNPSRMAYDHYWTTTSVEVIESGLRHE